MSAAAKDAVGDDYELILLNDGSSDRTWSIMRDLVATNPHLIAINLARRHGHQLAITAGLHMCRGDLILTIDADLQDPPELLGEMRRLMECNSSDVVYGVRRSRKGEGLLKRGTAAAFYRIMQRASPTACCSAARSSSCSAYSATMSGDYTSKPSIAPQVARFW